MAASIETRFDQAWTREPAAPYERPTDGAHAWLGLMLMLGTSIVTVRGLCWLAAQMIRLSHS